MGPDGGDEINIIKPGKNYGWPIVSYGRTYPGPWQAKAQNQPTHVGFEPPVIYWVPSISVSGLTFYTGDKLPKWKGDLFVGGLRKGEIPGTGQLDRVLLNENMEELRRETLLSDLHQRIRDVKQGPDGLLYVATDEQQGRDPAHRASAGALSRTTAFPRTRMTSGVRFTPEIMRGFAAPIVREGSPCVSQRLLSLHSWFCPYSLLTALLRSRRR